MADLLSAIAAYPPRIELGNIVQKVELTRYLADRTGLNKVGLAQFLDDSATETPLPTSVSRKVSMPCGRLVVNKVISGFIASVLDNFAR